VKVNLFSGCEFFKAEQGDGALLVCKVYKGIVAISNDGVNFFELAYESGRWGGSETNNWYARHDDPSNNLSYSILLDEDEKRASVNCVNYYKSELPVHPSQGIKINLVPLPEKREVDFLYRYDGGFFYASKDEYGHDFRPDLFHGGPKGFLRKLPFKKAGYADTFVTDKGVLQLADPFRRIRTPTWTDTSGNVYELTEEDPDDYLIIEHPKFVTVKPR
jgi:hypothetical protein